MATGSYGRMLVVKNLIRPIRTTGQGAQITEEEIEQVYLTLAREEIESRLVQYYEVPFQEIPIGGGKTAYPAPLDLMTEFLAAGRILVDIYTEATGTSVYTDKGNRYIAKSMSYVGAIQTREIIVPGQRVKAPDLWTPPRVRPIEAPPPAPAAPTGAGVPGETR